MLRTTRSGANSAPALRSAWPEAQRTTSADQCGASGDTPAPKSHQGSHLGRQIDACGPSAARDPAALPAGGCTYLRGAQVRAYMTTGHSVETQEFLTEKAYAMSANALLAFLIQSTIMVWLLVREPPALLGWRQLVPVYVIVARGRVEQHVEAPSISPPCEARHTRPPEGRRELAPQYWAKRCGMHV